MRASGQSSARGRRRRPGLPPTSFVSLGHLIHLSLDFLNSKLGIIIQMGKKEESRESFKIDEAKDTPSPEVL